MTKREALEKTIEMWEWIADECIDRRRKVDKFEYFRHIGLDKNHQPVNQCFLCDVAVGIEPVICLNCPITSWRMKAIYRTYNSGLGGTPLTSPCVNGLFGLFSSASTNDYELCSKLALGIVDLAIEELENMEE